MPVSTKVEWRNYLRSPDKRTSVKKENLPRKTCVSCRRSFTWRKKWKMVWDDVKYCSNRCSGEKPTGVAAPQILSEEDQDRIIQMAWEERPPFDVIHNQFGLKESETIEIMRRSLAPARFRAWRKRVHENGKLKTLEARNFGVGEFKSRMQRTEGSTKKQK